MNNDTKSMWSKSNELTETKIKKVVLRIRENENWIWLMVDLFETCLHLKKFELILTVRKKQPTFWIITFVVPDRSEFEKLKPIVWSHWFVVPTLWGKNQKILRWEKRMKY